MAATSVPSAIATTTAAAPAAAAASTDALPVCRTCQTTAPHVTSKYCDGCGTPFRAPPVPAAATRDVKATIMAEKSLNFAGRLWDRVNELYEKVRFGRATTKAIGSFVAELARIEERYGQSLLHLAADPQYTQPFTKEGLTLSSAFDAFRSHIRDTGSVHHAVAVRIDSVAIAPAHALQQFIKEKKAALMDESERCTTALTVATDHLHRQTTLQAKTLSAMKAKGIPVTAADEEESTASIQSAQVDEWRRLNQYRQNNTTTCEQIQKLELKRVRELRAILLDAYGVYGELNQNRTATTSGGSSGGTGAVLTALQQIDEIADIQHYVAALESGIACPWVAAIKKTAAKSNAGARPSVVDGPVDPSTYALVPSGTDDAAAQVRASQSLDTLRAYLQQQKAHAAARITAIEDSMPPVSPTSLSVAPQPFLPGPWIPVESNIFVSIVSANAKTAASAVSAGHAVWTITDDDWRRASYEALLLSLNLLMNCNAADRRVVESSIRPHFGVTNVQHTQLLRALSAPIIIRPKRAGANLQAQLSSSGELASVASSTQTAIDMRRGEADAKQSVVKGSGPTSPLAASGSDEVLASEISGDGVDLLDADGDAASDERLHRAADPASMSGAGSVLESFHLVTYRLSLVRTISAHFSDYFASPHEFKSWAQRQLGVLLSSVLFHVIYSPIDDWSHALDAKFPKPKAPAAPGPAAVDDAKAKPATGAKPPAAAAAASGKAADDKKGVSDKKGDAKAGAKADDKKQAAPAAKKPEPVNPAAAAREAEKKEKDRIRELEKTRERDREQICIGFDTLFRNALTHLYKFADGTIKPATSAGAGAEGASSGGTGRAFETSDIRYGLPGVDGRVIREKLVVSWRPKSVQSKAGAAGNDPLSAALTALDTIELYTWQLERARAKHKAAIRYRDERAKQIDGVAVVADIKMIAPLTATPIAAIAAVAATPHSTTSAGDKKAAVAVSAASVSAHSSVTGGAGVPASIISLAYAARLRRKLYEEVIRSCYVKPKNQTKVSARGSGGGDSKTSSDSLSQLHGEWKSIVRTVQPMRVALQISERFHAIAVLRLLFEVISDQSVQSGLLLLEVDSLIEKSGTIFPLLFDCVNQIVQTYVAPRRTLLETEELRVVYWVLRRLSAGLSDYHDVSVPGAVIRCFEMFGSLSRWAGTRDRTERAGALMRTSMSKHYTQRVKPKRNAHDSHSAESKDFYEYMDKDWHAFGEAIIGTINDDLQSFVVPLSAAGVIERTGVDRPAHYSLVQLASSLAEDINSYFAKRDTAGGDSKTLDATTVLVLSTLIQIQRTVFDKTAATHFSDAGRDQLIKAFPDVSALVTTQFERFLLKAGKQCTLIITRCLESEKWMRVAPAAGSADQKKAAMYHSTSPTDVLTFLNGLIDSFFGALKSVAPYGVNQIPAFLRVIARALDEYGAGVAACKMIDALRFNLTFEHDKYTIHSKKNFLERFVDDVRAPNRKDDDPNAEKKFDPDTADFTGFALEQLAVRIASLEFVADRIKPLIATINTRIDEVVALVCVKSTAAATATVTVSPAPSPAASPAGAVADTKLDFKTDSKSDSKAAPAAAATAVAASAKSAPVHTYQPIWVWWKAPAAAVVDVNASVLGSGAVGVCRAHQAKLFSHIGVFVVYLECRQPLWTSLYAPAPAQTSRFKNGGLQDSLLASFKKLQNQLPPAAATAVATAASSGGAALAAAPALYHQAVSAIFYELIRALQWIVLYGGRAWDGTNISTELVRDDWREIVALFTKESGTAKLPGSADSFVRILAIFGAAADDLVLYYADPNHKARAGIDQRTIYRIIKGRIPNAQTKKSKEFVSKAKHLFPASE